MKYSSACNLYIIPKVGAFSRVSLAAQPTDLNMKSRSWAGFLSSLQNYYKTKQKLVPTIQEILPLKSPCKREQEQNL